MVYSLAMQPLHLELGRDDTLLAIALLIQAGMVLTGLESFDELKAISLFHVIGFALEAFKTSGAVGSWSYPDPGYTKLFGVPLFSGFMYAGVGSYIIQAWRLFDLRIRHHPPHWMATAVAVLMLLVAPCDHDLYDRRQPETCEGDHSYRRITPG